MYFQITTTIFQEKSFGKTEIKMAEYIFKNFEEIGITKSPNKRFKGYINKFQDFKIIFCLYISEKLFLLEKNILEKYKVNKCNNYYFPGFSEVLTLNKKKLEEIKRYVYDFK